ncbi:TPA: hypothetical protein I9Y67_003504 [Elizabethkingia anophelis]|nr:hypothetical protein [Elizabethkingia anophelis]HAT3997998.1 hypothetical protein [Elizabethkingia anophelis]
MKDLQKVALSNDATNTNDINIDVNWDELPNTPYGTIGTIPFHDTIGQVDVNGGGQLQYTLPIELPPGVKNVAPQINLVYTSGSRNGIAGYGFNLSGITSISRVGKTIEKDRELKEIQLDYSDFYQFNGQRLILKSGEYGKDGAEYVTEKYSNVKVKSIGTNSEQNGPLYFEVTFEDGTQSWYGLNADGRTSLEYNITRWQDAQGNYISYNYVQGNGVVVIYSIEWGGNETAGISHFNSIIFNYQERSLKEISYVNGKKFMQNNLLSSIVVYSNEKQFKKYVISYNEASKYQFVKSIQEFNSQDEASAPVSFAYEEDIAENGILYNDSRYDDIFFGDNIVPGDFNGDGKLDFIKGNKLMLNRLEGTSDFHTINYSGTVVSRGTYIKDNILLSKDVFITCEDKQNEKYIVRGYVFNGIGVDEIFSQDLDLSSFNLNDVTDYHNIYGDGELRSNLSDLRFQEGDFNGDGISEFIVSIFKEVREDIIEVDWNGYPVVTGAEVVGTEVFDFYFDIKENIIKKLETPLTDYTKKMGNYVFSDKSYYKPIPSGDFNGDGKTDLYKFSDDIKIYAFDNASKTFKVKKQFPIYIGEGKILGDFTGDGKTDILVPVAKDSSDWIMYVSTGNEFIKHNYPNLHLYQPDWKGEPRRITRIKRSYFASDINKDGKSDFLVFQSEVWNRDEWDEWKNRDSSYGITYYQNDGVDVNGKPIFTKAYQLDPKDLDRNTEDINYSMYGEHYIPLVGNFRIAKLNTELSIVHKTKLITWSFGNKLNVISRIKEIKQGGITTDVNYASATKETGFYLSELPMQYPYVNIRENYNQSFVSQLHQEGRKQDFKYRNLITHLQGKGIIGFRQRARSSWYADGYENTKIWTGIEIDPLQEGLPVKEWSVRTIDDNTLIFPADISVSNNQLLSFNLTEYETHAPSAGVKAIVPKKTIAKDFLKDITNESSVIYGDYYLPKETTTKVNGDFAVTTTVINYMHNPVGVGKSYFIGRPESKTETMQAYGDTKVVREEYTYENNFLKTQKTHNRDNSGWVLERYNYDRFGNMVEKIITNSVDAVIQSEKSEYDIKGRFTVKKTDNLGLETNFLYNDWGQVIYQTDPLGNAVSNKYDAWGKLLMSKSNLGGTTTYTYEKLQNNSTKVTEYAPDGTPEETYTNKLGQQYGVRGRAFNRTYIIDEDLETTVGDTYVYVSTQFDALGRKISETEPYLNNEEQKWNNIIYDDSVFPPVVTAKTFSGKEMKTITSGRTTIVEELNGYKRITKKTIDALGNLISSEDKGGIINFTFNAVGEQIKAQYGDNIVTTKYDVWGRKSEFHDPSNGLYKYEYNGFGQIKKEVSPRGYKEYFYNDKGQLVDETEKSNIVGLTDKSISVSYNDKGFVTGKNGTSNGKSYSTTLIYDQYGRLLETTENSNGRVFTQKDIVYDSLSRIVSYEKRVTSGGVYTKAIVENVYDIWSGQLYQVKDKVSGKILWRLYEANGKGQVLRGRLGMADITNTYDPNNFLTQTEQRSKKGLLFGSRYTFDAVKNELKERSRQGNFVKNEVFTYDDNNRLIQWTNPKTDNISFNKYDLQGRITENDQLGTVQFGDTTKIYQPTGAKLNTIGKQNYLNAQIQRVIYNENNDPLYIQSKKGDVRFEYGLTNMRQMVTYGQAAPAGNNGAIEDFATSDWEGVFTKYYSEDGSFEVVRNNTSGEEKHILYVGGTPYESNIVYLKDFIQSSGSYNFLHKDYLGSILAISDEEGNLVQEAHFDAWGQLAIGSINLLGRGYTSHEHFEDIGIIHMNGRLYDPLLRRFLNADENIQDPYNTQNYNKYGYVMNNPLLYNDPSGEVWWIPLAAAAAMYAFSSYYMNQPMTISGLLEAINMSYITAGIAAGVDQIFQIASTALNLSAIGGKVMGIIANGVSGAISSLANGGNFGSALLTSFATSSVVKGVGLLGGDSSVANSGAKPLSDVSDTANDIGIDRVLEGVVLTGKATWTGELLKYMAIQQSIWNSEWSNYNLEQSRSRYSDAIANSKTAQSIYAGEKFLFLELPATVLGGELFTAGWRAARAGQYLGRAWSYLTNNGGTFYRAMSSAEFAALQSNNGLTYLTGKELFVSSSLKYSEAYLQKSGYDVLVKFNMKRGAMNYFNKVGVLHRTAAGSSGWAARGNLLWKMEQGVMNLGIQQNTHMFNPWIKTFKIIP